MDLMRSSEMRRLFGDSRASVDLVRALEEVSGQRFAVSDLRPYLRRDIPVSIRVNTRTGEVGVKDPTAPIRFYFNVDPDMLDGDYVSLRTNALAASFDNFTVTRR
jgi:hypothetical protein